MKLVYSLPAEIDLQQIYLFIAEDNEDAAISTILKLEERLEALHKMPRMGVVRDDIEPGFHLVVIGNYNVFYRIEDEQIYIVRVLHSARDIESQFE